LASIEELVVKLTEKAYTLTNEGHARGWEVEHGADKKK